MDKEALNFAIENGIINLSYIQDEFEMNKREKILLNHKWAISQGKDGYWRTYLPDEQKGRRMLKKHSREEIENELVRYYQKEAEKPKIFNDIYYMWRGFQDEIVSNNTISKYKTDYKRYFENTEFINIKVNDLGEDEIKVFIINTVRSKKLCKKACKTLFGYVKNSIQIARRKKIILDDPMEFLMAKDFYKYCTEITKKDSDKIVSDDDMKMLQHRIEQDHEEHPSYIPTYAVQLAMLTGMRVGEIAALRWDCITKDSIIVDKSEKYDRIEKRYFIDSTKNGRTRIFPLTKDLRDLFAIIKKIEMRYGYLSEWVFSNENGRIHASVISSCSKNKCRQLNINEKGIHAYRKTLNSKMRCDGVSSVVAASLLGHSPEVNEKYYTFDICSLKEKAEIVENVTKNMIAAK